MRADHRWLIRTLVAVGALVAAAPASVGSSTAQGPVAESITNWAQVDGGVTHTCAVTLAHRAYCWGDDEIGGLGDGNGRVSSNVPVQVKGATTDWAAVSAGAFTSCGLKITGRLFCWGDDRFGQLGDKHGRVSRNAPVQVAGGHTDWTEVSVGGTLTCGIRAPGRLFCWGADTFGGLGNGGSNTSRNAPAEVAGAATNWSSVSANGWGACARKSTGRVFCWGEDFRGQVGDGPTHVNRTRPVPVANGGTSWQSLSAGLQHRCAVRTNGRLFCWGADDQAQLGAPGQNVVDRDVPTEVEGSTQDWASVAAGGGFTCAIKQGHTLWCWGANSSAQMGNGTFAFGARQFTPALVPGGIADWQSLGVGESHACAIRQGGALYCWGDDAYGQAGTGPVPDTARVVVPTQVSP